MNNIDKQYQTLLQDVLNNGVEKKDRTGTGTISVFGRQIRHKMSEGFPLLTTKKMAWKPIIIELLWFLRGDTNIKYLVDNDCYIWVGDAYKAYLKKKEEEWINGRGDAPSLSMDEFVSKIKQDEWFANRHGDLGPIYGKQWRKWSSLGQFDLLKQSVLKEYNSNTHPIAYGPIAQKALIDDFEVLNPPIDQFANLIDQLKTNPDSRRLMVNAWNVADVSRMILPPCHYGFQVYTRELSGEERAELYQTGQYTNNVVKLGGAQDDHYWLDLWAPSVPKRAISLMWNQRSVDTFLGLPFNIASYGLLLEIIAKEINMIPDELIGNLGDVHLYLNHIKQAKEQLIREPFGLQ